MLKVAINGYGQIGRVVHRVLLRSFPDIAVVAINAGKSTDLRGWMYLLKYDSIYGPLDGHDISCDEHIDESTGQIGEIHIDDSSVAVFAQRDPSLLPWKSYGIDVVIESTGVVLTPEKASLHLRSGAKAVVVSAPPKKGSDGSEIPVYVRGVNDETIESDLVSNASCTTNSIAPVVQLIDQMFGIEKAMMTTIHSYTSDQRLLDGGHDDYYRARAAAINIVPTTTGASKAAAKAVPSLTGKFEGLAVRVPTPVGSLSDITMLLKKDVTKDEVNQALIEGSRSRYAGILGVTEDPLVSTDIKGSSYSSIVDMSLTQVVGGNLLKIVCWYDNEWGYATRLAEMVEKVGSRG
jgi:glyceraldehyde 3-phosphate dehydrogenase